NVYESHGREDSFGDVIPVEKTLQGKGYYKVKKDAKDLRIVYSPAIERAKGETHEEVEWKIGVLVQK
ncbi:hypothetical protein P4530_15715, partial [Bacillus thuringiensis]|nr:hypothetical protein [Bacillus thuringiensis]